MREPSFGLAAALAIGTPNPNTIGDLPVGGILITATVAGTAQAVLDGGQTIPIAFPVGSVIFNLAVVSIASATGTANYYQLA